jgi:hypothetical protein
MAFSDGRHFRDLAILIAFHSIWTIPHFPQRKTSRSPNARPVHGVVSILLRSMWWSQTGQGRAQSNVAICVEAVIDRALLDAGRWR